MNVKRKIFYIHNGDNYKDERLQFDHSFAELDSIELIEELEKLGAKVHKVSEIAQSYPLRDGIKTITVYMWMQDEHIYHATMYSEEEYTETFLYELNRISVD